LEFKEDLNATVTRLVQDPQFLEPLSVTLSTILRLLNIKEIPAQSHMTEYMRSSEIFKEVELENPSAESEFWKSTCHTVVSDVLYVFSDHKIAGNQAVEIHKFIGNLIQDLNLKKSSAVSEESVKLFLPVPNSERSFLSLFDSTSQTSARDRLLEKDFQSMS